MVKIKLAALMLNSFLCIVLLAFLILRYIYLTKMSKPYYFLFPDSYQKLVKYFFDQQLKRYFDGVAFDKFYLFVRFY